MSERPKEISTPELERVIEAFERAEVQVNEMAAMMGAAFMIALEPIRDRLDKLEHTYDLHPARAVMRPDDEEEEDNNG